MKENGMNPRLSLPVPEQSTRKRRWLQGTNTKRKNSAAENNAEKTIGVGQGAQKLEYFGMETSYIQQRKSFFFNVWQARPRLA